MVVLAVLAAVALGIYAGVKRIEKERALPDWNQELADEMSEMEKLAEEVLEEQHRNEELGDGGLDARANRPPRTPAEDSFAPAAGQEEEKRTHEAAVEEELADETLEEETDGITESPSTAVTTTPALADDGKNIGQVNDIVARPFDPILYDRHRGWEGSTYDEAVQFCSQSKLARVLCPVGVYCPDGKVPMDIPGGENIWELMEKNGDTVDDEHWAPIGDAQNGWIQVGWHEDETCKTYQQMFHEDPPWGISGTGSVEVSGYLMCCLEPSSIDDSLSTDEATPTMPEDTEKEMGQAYTTIARLFDPILLDRKRGWEGSTYDEAVQFCSQSEPARVLCPAEVYCPDGKVPMAIPDGSNIWELIDRNGDNVGDEHWAPIGEAQNGWIQVGWREDKTCKTYKQSTHEDPSWGVSGIDSPSSGISGFNSFEVTGYIMCCLEPSSINDSLSASEATTTTSADEEQEMGQRNDVITPLFHPILYDRNRGWEAYAKAVDFCSESEPARVLCPAEVYCPDGKVPKATLGKDNIWELIEKNGDNVFSEHWAPIGEAQDNWIQVGLHEGETCKTYKMKVFEDPPWRISGTNSSEVSGYLMCCLEPSSINDSLPIAEMTTTTVAATITSIVETTPSPTTLLPSTNPTPLPLSTTEATTTTVAATTTSIGEVAPRPTTPPPSETPTAPPTFRLMSYKYDTLSHEPVWYNRSEGWSGRTHEEAIHFCRNKENAKGEHMMLCPFEAYCPLGVGSTPLGGLKEDVSWAPFINQHNRWVGLGTAAKCREYKTLYPSEPAWGITGNDNEEITRHVMCCVDREATAEATQPTTSPPSKNPTPPPITSHETIWYDRSNGWSGQTYKEAIDFCSTKTNGKGESMMLCYYDAYCPLGVGSVPDGGDKEDVSWAPILNSQNHWVGLSADAKCKEYNTLYPAEPAWGITGNDNEEMTRHVCCVKPSKLGMAVAATTDEETPATSLLSSSLVDSAVQLAIQDTFSEDEFEAVYTAFNNRISNNLQPVLHNRFSGWTGHTYIQASDFCNSNGSKVPCPYESLCPNGTGEQPIINFLDGPVWSPISGRSNAWVEIHDRGQCTVQTNLLTTQDVTRYVLCCKTEGAALSGTDSNNVSSNVVPAAPTSPSQPSSAEAGGRISIDDNRFRPVTFTRSQGWAGSTYGEALTFCALQESKIPCPFVAICPMASRGPPYGGVVGMLNSAWAPIMDSANSWVQIGGEDTCMKYTDINPHPPMWGLTGKEGEAITPNILCCEEQEESGLQDDEVGEVGQLTESEEAALSFHPMWFGRKHGYHGTTHKEAALFCNSVGAMHLCPVEAYCPNGPRDSKSLYLQKDAFEGEQWAPASTYNDENSGIGNNWIMIGKKDNDPYSTCLLYEQIYDGELASWTADGGKAELKENVLCCAYLRSIETEQDIERESNSIWLDASYGWRGGSYDDGVEFCQEMGGKKLCPLPAYCPQGPGMQPVGGHSADFNLEGEQWAPFAHEGDTNTWVLVGRKYGNSATTCYSHKQLEGSPPTWGMSSRNASAKQHIQCCL